MTVLLTLLPLIPLNGIGVSCRDPGGGAGQPARDHRDSQGPATAATTRAAPPATTQAVRTSLADDVIKLIEAGKVRPFGPAGPQMTLHDQTYASVAAQGDAALDYLAEILASPSPFDRMNAYDFIGHFPKESPQRARAQLLLRSGLSDENYPTRFFVKILLARE